jgi:two-component sensor histidine kinase
VLLTYECTVIVAAVDDDGLGCGPRDDSPGGGFGLQIIRRLSSSCEVIRNPDSATGTRVRMVFGPTTPPA